MSAVRLYLILAVLCAILIPTKNDIVVKRPTKRKPRCSSTGVFFLFSDRSNTPKAGCQLHSVQPFADVVGNYTCRNRIKK